MTLSISPILATTAQAATRGVVLQPGTVVSAQVLQSLDVNLVRIAIASLTLDVVTTLPLQVGQTLQLAVTQTKDGINLAPVSPQTTSAQRGEAVLLDDIPLAPKMPGSAESVRPALSPDETKAVAVATQSAVTRQAGLSPLFANLAVSVATGSLPPPVLVAAAQVLGLGQPADRVLTGVDIKAALQSSGLLREASLAVATPSQGVPMPDMKAALSVLRQALATWIGQPATTTVAKPGSAPARGTQWQASSPIQNIASGAASAPSAVIVKAATSAIGSDPDPIIAIKSGLLPPIATIAARDAQINEPVPRHATLVPPFRYALPSAQSVSAPSLAPDAEPVSIAQQLIADTDSALARQTLLQIASLPEQVTGSRHETLQPRWNFEIPFVTAQGTAMAQFAISRDGSATDIDPAQRVWRARFSLDMEPAGPVHALISFSGDTTSVKMWAERPTTAAQLRVNATQLSASLDRAALKAGDIVVADGAPAQGQALRAGHFLSRAS